MMLHVIKRILKKLSGSSKEQAMPPGVPDGDRLLINRIKAKRLTYLSNKKLASLANTCRTIEVNNVQGAFVEAGCALGGSSILIASLKKQDRPLFVYDVFGMIPPPTSDDTIDVHDRYSTIAEGKSKGIDGDKYYGYQKNLYEIVQSNLSSFGIDLEKQSVYLIKGLLQDTMKINQAIAFAHIDVDWYDPVMVSMERIFPKLVIGGSIILDDYHDWGGCRKAVDAYLQEIKGEYSLDDSAGSMKITRING